MTRENTIGLLQALLIFLCATAGLSSQGHADGEAQVGVIQYNVKRSQGGWTIDGNVIEKQFRIIADKVKSGGVDFISLEQAGESKGADWSLISDGLNQEKLVGWNTIVSACNKDVIELAYSSNWTLVASTINSNPSIDERRHERGWIPHGCEPNGNGRPYKIAYFYNGSLKMRLLFIVTHMPHCREIGTCTSTWNVSQFREDLRVVLGETDMSQVSFIMAGDLNELGDSGDPALFGPMLSAFGDLKISQRLLTCCNDSNWIFAFDRIITNSALTPNAIILDEFPYPLNPNFLGQNEEHKAIYGLITFPIAP